jgi:hypothetical protein
MGLFFVVNPIVSKRNPLSLRVAAIRIQNGIFDPGIVLKYSQQS